jgi:hypothetical protein
MGMLAAVVGRGGAPVAGGGGAAAPAVVVVVVVQAESTGTGNIGKASRTLLKKAQMFVQIAQAGWVVRKGLRELQWRKWEIVYPIHTQTHTHTHTLTYIHFLSLSVTLYIVHRRDDVLCNKIARDPLALPLSREDLRTR